MVENERFNEVMNLYKFRAQQLLLFEKENKYWIDYCKEKNAVCLGHTIENDNKLIRDAGVQASIRDKKCKLTENTLQKSLQRLQPFVLKKPNNRISDMKLQNSQPFVLKKPSNNILDMKLQNSSCIPQGRQRNKTTTMKTCSASLSKADKPDSFQIGKGLISEQQVRKKTSKNASKSKVNIALKRKKQNSKTISEESEQVELKDINLENVVDGILEDLITEAVVIMNKANKRKELKKFFPSSEAQISEAEENVIGKPSKLSPVSEDRKNLQKVSSDDLKSVKFDLFRTSYKAENENNIKILENDKCVDKFDDPNVIILCHDQEERTSRSVPASLQNSTKISSNLKSLEIISVDSGRAVQIAVNRKQYWTYLKYSLWTKKGSFNPWNLINSVAENLLDDCILDVSAELCQIPDSLVKELYNQEFMEEPLLR